MMISNSVGIILRKVGNSRHKIALLDKKYGRIESVVNVTFLSVGSLVEYGVHQERGIFFLTDVKPLYVPVSFARFDLLFLHHVLELIYYFAPLYSCVDGLFDLIAFLYTSEHMLVSMKFKKFFLLKLLTLLGAAPDSEIVSLVCMGQLNEVTIDQFHDALLDGENEKRLDRWLWYCVWQHPYVNEFKTVNFLEQNRTI